jgi:hypothetical protein
LNNTHNSKNAFQIKTEEEITSYLLQGAGQIFHDDGIAAKAMKYHPIYVFAICMALSRGLRGGPPWALIVSVCRGGIC